ncbi:MAG: biopolymer transporter ExbD [Spirochaetaceae bacterium]|nr:MAG: biopolymer transporter ExbD [Spirochaetaceae bacterium]
MRFHRRLSPNANVDLVPMIDVVFQLVIFFMVSSTFVLTPGIAIDLPASSSSEPVVLNRLVVTVVSRSEIYVNRERVALSDMEATLASIAPEDADGRPLSVIIEGDRAVPYDTLVAVLDVLRRNGYRGIALRTLEENG